MTFFKYAELTEIVRQDGKLFMDLLNKIWVGNIDDAVKDLLKARPILKSGKTNQKMPFTYLQKMNQLGKGIHLF